MLEPGTKIEFRSKHYMGLGIHKKKDWYTAFVRKDEGGLFHIVYINPFGEKMFAAIPIGQLLTDEFTYCIINHIDLDVIKIDVDYHVDLWHEYIDKEAQHQVHLNIMTKVKQ